MLQVDFEMQQAGAFAASSDSSSDDGFDLEENQSPNHDNLKPPEDKEIDSASAFSRQSKVSHISYVPLADFADLDLSYEEENEMVKQATLKMRQNCVISAENKYKTNWS